MSEYKGNDRTAMVYYSSAKAEWLVRVENDRHRDVKFYTEQDAEDYAEDYVLMLEGEDSTLIEPDELIQLQPVVSNSESSESN